MRLRKCAIGDSAIDFLAGNPAEACGQFDRDERIALDHQCGGDLRIKIRFDAFGKIRHRRSNKRESMFELL